MDISKLNEEIDAAEQKLNELKGQRQQVESMDPACYLATVLHERLCTWNHTDGCSWYYAVSKDGKHDWSEYAHSEYLARAKRALQVCEDHNIQVDAALKLFSAMTNR
jgi:hypothetical protein